MAKMRMNSTNRWSSSLGHIFFVLRVFSAIAILSGCSESQGPQYEIFPPVDNKGAIVVVVSGLSGTGYYRDFSSKLSELGYYTVLMEGMDLLDPFGMVQNGADNLLAVITDTQSSPQAIPGKVALVGFSLGGAGVLKYGANLKDQVSAVVAYYPAISAFGGNLASLSAKLQTPVLLLAGEEDDYENCCLIESMRMLAEAQKTVPFELVEYPDAGHGFNLNTLRFRYRANDAADSWERTVAFLNRLHPPGGK